MRIYGKVRDRGILLESGGEAMTASLALTLSSFCIAPPLYLGFAYTVPLIFVIYFDTQLDLYTKIPPPSYLKFVLPAFPREPITANRLLPWVTESDGVDLEIRQRRRHCSQTDYGIDYNDEDNFTTVSPYYVESVYGTEGYDGFDDFASIGYASPRLDDLYEPRSISAADVPTYVVTRRIPEFYGETTNSNEYYWKAPDLNESFRQREANASKSYSNPAPFYSETTNRAAYQPHRPVIPSADSSREKEQRKRLDVPFYGETSHQAAYTPKAKSQIPMEMRTTQTEDFTRKSTRRCPAEVVLNNRRYPMLGGITTDVFCLGRCAGRSSRVTSSRTSQRTDCGLQRFNKFHGSDGLPCPITPFHRRNGTKRKRCRVELSISAIRISSPDTSVASLMYVIESSRHLKSKRSPRERRRRTASGTGRLARSGHRLS
uniref:Uncharacterized protein n=1 Tax=Steinernema glaseri TaxID=37863 RepID=A0A1I7Y947_9BILA